MLFMTVFVVMALNLRVSSPQDKSIVYNDKVKLVGTCYSSKFFFVNDKNITKLL